MTGPRTRAKHGTLGRLQRSRYLIYAWVRRDFSVRYTQSGLGFLWAVLRPLLYLLVYGFVFRQVLDVQPDRGPYVLFAYCGLVVWSFFVSAMNFAVPSLINNAAIVTRVYFPREAVPLAAVGVVVVDLLISTAVLIVIVFVTGADLPLTVFWLIPVYAALLLLTSALALFASSLSVFIRDIRQFVPVALQMLFIATPIMYPPELVPEKWRWAFDVNPLVQIIEETRKVVIDGSAPDFLLLAAISAVSGVVCLLGVRYIAAVEDRMVDVL